jgi:hypothetical protein
VNEVLAEVLAEERLRRNAADPALVLIVGDSPPPPWAVGDPIWEHLVDGSDKTGCRLGPDLPYTLVELAKLGVPVAYVYLRPADRERETGIAVTTELSDYVDLHQRTIDALSLVEGWTLLPADRTEASLVRAFERALALGATPRRVAAGMRVLEVLEGGAA